MRQITINATLCEKLRAVKETADLCDEDGVLIGIFEPFVGPRNDEGTIPPMREDDIERGPS